MRKPRGYEERSIGKRRAYEDFYQKLDLKEEKYILSLKN